MRERYEGIWTRHTHTNIHTKSHQSTPVCQSPAASEELLDFRPVGGKSMHNRERLILGI
ncbi:hypothetical protein BDN72DRAFT_841982 [Pluteus cervinus]|uniref:Uncharacterized protein n=1 Tax=Pluteus cervinus TaxID=181527 RepID=A0ACD3ASL4_9AGAR|nr:hypothetical protein BDN72DRAFT_841982 [Pluteus cervinus]